MACVGDKLYHDYVRLVGEYRILNKEAVSLICLFESQQERHELACIIEAVDNHIRDMQSLIAEWHPELDVPDLREQTDSLFDSEPPEHICYEHRETCKWLC